MNPMSSALALHAPSRGDRTGGHFADLEDDGIGGRIKGGKVTELLRLVEVLARHIQVVAIEDQLCACVGMPFLYIGLALGFEGGERLLILGDLILRVGQQTRHFHARVRGLHELQF